MSIKHLQIHRPTKLSSGARLSPFRDQAIWSRHNQKILKTCALVVLPMLAFTIAILSLVFANQIDPYDCPNADLCSTTNTTTAVSYQPTRAHCIHDFNSHTLIHLPENDWSVLHYSLRWSSGVHFLVVCYVRRHIGCGANDVVQLRHGSSIVRLEDDTRSLSKVSRLLQHQLDRQIAQRGDSRALGSWCPETQISRVESVPRKTFIRRSTQLHCICYQSRMQVCTIPEA